MFIKLQRQAGFEFNIDTETVAEVVAVVVAALVFEAAAITAARTAEVELPPFKVPVSIELSRIPFLIDIISAGELNCKARVQFKGTLSVIVKEI